MDYTIEKFERELMQKYGNCRVILGYNGLYPSDGNCFCRVQAENGSKIAEYWGNSQKEAMEKAVDTFKENSETASA